MVLKATRNGEVFDDFICTDECSVQQDSHGRLCFHKINEPRKLKGKHKHPLKVLWLSGMGFIMKLREFTRGPGGVGGVSK